MQQNVDNPVLGQFDVLACSMMTLNLNQSTLQTSTYGDSKNLFVFPDNMWDMSRMQVR